MAGEQTIAQRVRAKYPGVYDDLNDQQLESAVLAKHPEYKDLPRTPSSPPAREKDIGDWIEQDLPKGVANLYTGIAKGAANTLFGLGKIAHDYTPVGRISDAISPGAFDERPRELVPDGTMQRLGFTGEQVGEFFIPTGAAGKLARVAEVAKSAGLTKAQTGSTGQAVLSAGLSAAIPAVVAGAGAASRAMRGSAEKTVAQALGATKEAMKAEAAKLAPQMLDRGVSGTRAGMLAQASAQVKAVGQLIEQEVAAQAAAGATVSGLQVRGAVQLAADALKVSGAAGQKLPIAGAEQAIKELDKLDEFVAALGNDIPFDKAQHIKQVWQHIVSKAGLYGPKAQATATDAAAASALREGAGVFKELLAAGSASLDDLNREFAFWKGLKTVLTATQARTQAQGMGITASIGGSTTGAVIGAMAGGPGGSGVGAVLGPAVVKAMQSAWWKTKAVAPLKNALAEALASGNTGAVKTVAGRIAAAMPATLRTAAAQ